MGRWYDFVLAISICRIEHPIQEGIFISLGQGLSAPEKEDTENEDGCQLNRSFSVSCYSGSKVRPVAKLAKNLNAAPVLTASVGLAGAFSTIKQ